MGKQQIKKPAHRNPLKFGKKGESLCCLNQDSFLPPHCKLSEVETVLQTAAARNLGFPLSPAPSWRASFQERAEVHHFSSCCELPVAEAKL